MVKLNKETPMNYHELSPELYEIERSLISSPEYCTLINALDEHNDEEIEYYCSHFENVIGDETYDDYEELANNLVYYASNEVPWCGEMLKAFFGI